MATITERFGFTKPAGSDPASVVPLNSNTDLVELYLGRTQDMIAPLYDDTETYDVGDIVTYESNLYKCITAISTAETFDPTKWEATTAVEEGSGGGGGSSVIPNPTGTPTDTLSTVSIDGTIFNIEGSGGGGGEGEGVEIYSESEYIVGKWIDGKKLYQKTIDFGAMPAQGDSKSVAHNISDIDKIISWEAFGVNQSGQVMFVPNVSRGNVASQTSMSVNSTNVNIFNGSSSDITSAYNGYVTIRYTKTVETPAPAWGGSVTNNYAGFIDADNVIYSTTSSSTTDTYTATDDCYIMQDIVTGSNVSTVTIDGETVAEYLVSGTQIISYNAFLKKGQVLTVTHGGTAQHTIKVFGITYASGGSETPATDASEVEYDNTTSQLTADNVQEAIDEVVANADTASEDILTLQNVQGYDEYDETQTYAVGDYAIYNNHVYECTTAVSTAEPFDSTKWSQTSIEQIIDGVKGDITQLNSSKENKIKRYYRNGTTNISASTGNLFSCAFSIKYTNDMVISFTCRVLVQNVPAGVTNNPVITISGLPNDIPAFEGVGALTQKGTDSTEVGDGCTFSHAQGSTSMTVYSFNFMGTARTGWVCYTVPGVY